MLVSPFLAEAVSIDCLDLEVEIDVKSRFFQIADSTITLETSPRGRMFFSAHLEPH